MLKLFVEVFLYFFLVVIVFCRPIFGTEYKEWQPRSSEKFETLYCPNYCFDKPEPNDIERCCSCGAKTCWELDPPFCTKTFSNLYIEYVDNFGINTALTRPEDQNLHIDGYFLQHVNGYMTSFPENMCTVSNISSMIVSHNYISSLEGLTCLKTLRVFQADHNKIEYIPNTTFIGLNLLRVLDLSWNSILDIEPASVCKDSLNIFYIDLSFNPIEEIDVTNFFCDGPMCELRYLNTSIHEFTNKLDFKANSDNGKVYGPGKILMDNSFLSNMINYTILGINYSDVYQVLQYRTSLTKLNINCDCKLVPFIEHVPPSKIINLYPEFGNISCVSPENLKGVLVYEFVANNSRLDSVICDVDYNCPKRCACYEQTSQKKVIVNCTNAGLLKMPERLPTGYWGNSNIELLFSGNQIQTLESMPYMEHVVGMDISDNPITHIQTGAVQNMKEDITLEISGTHFETLPQYFLKIDPESVLFRGASVTCTCDNLWIGDWRRLVTLEKDNVLYCDVEGQRIPAEDVTESFLKCPTHKPLPIWLIVSGSCVVVSGITILSLVVYCRNEIFILRRRVSKPKSSYLNLVNDIFLSFDDDNREVLKWINADVLPYLEDDSGYEVFNPALDLNYGGVRQDDVSDAICKSRIGLIILSKSYLSQEHPKSDFETMWNNFKNSISLENIVVVNFEHLTRSAIHDSRLRALLRVGATVDFSIRDTRLIIRLKHLLGRPLNKGWAWRRPWAPVSYERDDSSIRLRSTDCK